MERSLQDIFDQLGLQGVTPPGVPGETFVPYDTSVKPGTAFGAPYPGGGPAPMPAATGGGPAPVSTGYTPQPRPELPRPLRKGPGSEMFTNYGNLWSPSVEDQDPLAALLGTPSTGPGFAQQTPPSRALSPQWAGAQQGATNPQYGAGQAQIDRQAQQVMPTESEKALLRRSPAYARAINRIHTLDRLRSQKGL